MMLVGPVEDQRFHAPVSGAKQLKHSGPIGKRTMISHTGAYSCERVGVVALGQEHVAQPGHLQLCSMNSPRGGRLPSNV